MFARTFAPIVIVLLAGFLTLLVYTKPASATVPDGFEDRLVTGVGGSTALASAPDGRLLITTKQGQVRVYKDEALLPTPALNLSSKTCSNSERGLLGIAVDPEFDAGDEYVYLYYTAYQSGACVNRVSRFEMSGDTLDPASEKKLLDNIPSPNGNHNAGDVQFGKDGYLYVSVGDGGCYYANRSRCQYENPASREQHILLGKILRITSDGEIPSDNPFIGSDSVRCNTSGHTTSEYKCQETYATGLRNPFRIAFDPDATGTSFRINEVGGGRWEEIDDGKAGADYAWNLCEGRHDNPYRSGSVNCAAAPYTPPIHEYSHGTGCSSITGGAFVPDGAWPSEYDDAYLFGDYVCNRIFMLAPRDGGGYTSTLFASGLGGGGPVSMAFGPYDSDKALYYTTFAGGGQVRRISYEAGNRTPIAVAETVSENYGSSLAINFDGSKSSDPNGNTPLTYVWDFGDGSTPEETTESTTNHTYKESAKYTVTLKVRDNEGKESATDTIEVFPGDTPPEPSIEAPTTSDTPFRVGEEITLQGSANDPEDGAVPEGNLEWEVIRHHNGSHTHPWFSGTGNDPTSLKFDAPAPEDLLSIDPDGNYLEIRLTATDSLGLEKTVTQKLPPNTVEVRFATRPWNFQLTVNGQAFRAPKTFISWEDYDLNVSAPRQKLRSGGPTWVFRSWSDGGARVHTITTPSDPTTYTATFRKLWR